MREAASTTRGAPSPTPSPARTEGQQRRTASRPETPAVPSIVREVFASPGQPLDANTRASTETRFGHDFGRVRVHTDARAAESARAVGALAYTVGRDIAFGAGRYAPGTPAGRRLLAHELAHVVQQQSATPAGGVARVGGSDGAAEREAERAASVPAGGRSAVVVRDGEPVLRRQEPGTVVLAAGGSSGGAEAAQATMIVSLSGLTFIPDPSFRFAPGPMRPQVLAIVLKRLLGAQYKRGLEAKVSKDLADRGARGTGTLDPAAMAEGGESLEAISFDVTAVDKLFYILSGKRKLEILISPDQEQLLLLGLISAMTFAEIRSWGRLPAWYTQYMFDREMAQHSRLLGELREFVQAGPGADRARGVALVERVIAALEEPARVLEAVRADPALAKSVDKDAPKNASTQAALAFRALWVLPEAGEGAAPAPERIKNEGLAATFLGWVRSQRELAQGALETSEARTELLARFYRFAMRATTARRGDEELSEKPAEATDEPWPSKMSTFPPVEPPLFMYDAALKTDHRFTMGLQFTSALDAFAAYEYLWERVEIPKTGDEKERVERPTYGEVSDVRFSRATRYNEADVRRVIDELGVVPGIGAMDLIAANNIMRYMGTGIRLFLDRLTTPSHEMPIVFPAQGLYLVRCRAVPILEGDEEVVRPPSVAYQLVLARDPAEMAASQVRGTIETRAAIRARMVEIQALLDAPVSPPDRPQLERELATLSGMVGSIGDVLDARRKELEGRIKDIEGGKQGHGELSALKKQLEEVEKTIQRRKDRASGLASAPEELVATFVSDLGYSVALTLEAGEVGKAGKLYEYRVSDLTAAKSGVESGYGATKAEAIKDGIKRLLEGSAGYGRGQVAVQIDGKTHPIRIEAGPAMIFSEAVENATTIVSVAAIAAAPFTGGASLTILIPVGAVGALPSVYRLAKASEYGTLGLDWQTAGDVVNVVGGIVGLAQVATPLRMVRLGRAIMITGFGADGLGIAVMGAQLGEQIDALRGLPEGERKARLLEIVGMSMMQAGISVGGSIASKRYESGRADAAAKRPGGAETAPSHPRGGEGTPARPGGEAEGGTKRPGGEPDAGGSGARGQGDAAGGRPTEPRSTKDVEAVPGAEPELLGTGAVRGSKVYEVSKTDKNLVTGEPSLEKGVDEAMSNPGLAVTKAQVKKVDVGKTGTSSVYEMTVTPATGAAQVVKITVQATDSLGGAGSHGKESGPARVDLKRSKDGWEATIRIREGVSPADVVHITGHEFNEIAKVVHDFPDADAATVATQMEAGLFFPTGKAKPTAHDYAAAHELFGFQQEHAKLKKDFDAFASKRRAAKKAHDDATAAGDAAGVTQAAKDLAEAEAGLGKLKPEVESAKARMDRMLKAMGVTGDADAVAVKQRLDTLREMGLPRELDVALRPEAEAAASSDRRPGGYAFEAERVKHLLYPEDHKGSFPGKGIGGGHLEAELASFLKEHPEYHLEPVDTKAAGGATARKYEQYQYRPGGKYAGKPPPGAEWGGPNFNKSDWVRAMDANNPAIPLYKTTLDNAATLLDEGANAWENWESANKPAPGSRNISWGPADSKGGIRFIGYADWDATRGRFKIISLFPEAAWIP